MSDADKLRAQENESAGLKLDSVDHKTIRRDRALDNPEFHKEVKAVAAQRHRFGCRRIRVIMERTGMIMNHRDVYLLYRGEAEASGADEAGNWLLDASAEGSMAR
ncbi:hypothetical protein K3551_04395 [Jannaschia sp. M317]|nr:hypothetical protein K3551_04395 [Jannaschia sp. M317]